MTAYGWVPPEELPELQTVLDLLAAGTPRRRWRLVEVACAKDHRLLEVFRTAAGPTAYGLAYPAIGASFADVRREALAMRLTGTGVHLMVDAQCPCGGTQIPTSWILERLDGRRVVWINPSDMP